MGCWGFGIMQSDNALDIECEIYDLCNISSNAKNVKIEIEKNWDKLQNMCNLYKEVDPYEYAVSWQTLCVVLMRHGVQVDEKMNENIQKSMKSCPEYKSAVANIHRLEDFIIEEIENGNIIESPWSQTKTIDRVKQRVQAIDGLCKEFENYIASGFKPFEHQDMGLIETIQKKSMNQI